MALFFQLLTEEELRTLTVEQLARLRAAFYHELYTNQAIRGSSAGALLKPSLLSTASRDRGNRPTTLSQDVERQTLTWLPYPRLEPGQLSTLLARPALLWTSRVSAHYSC